MRTVFIAAITLLSACGQAESPPPLPEAPAPIMRPAWFICDAVNAPVLLVFERDGAIARVAQYAKPTGEIVQRTEYRLGESEGAAGSIYVSLIQNGAEVGAIRQINADMLDVPGAAYTPAYSSVRIGERDISCRWLPRTRLMGFTGRRTIVMSEDGDGDLIYQSYDFASAAEAVPIEVSENGRTTTFSLEVRDGVEALSPEGTHYQFRADAETDISVTIDPAGVGRVTVNRHGPNAVQVEDLIAYVIGSGAE